MGLIGQLYERANNAVTSRQVLAVSIDEWRNGPAGFRDNKYRTFAEEGYGKNELVYGAIRELATSASEPHLRALVGGKWIFEHPLLTLLNRPTPFMGRFRFFSTVILHLCLAGNAYALIVRDRRGRPVEMILMRPDRVTPVPDPVKTISHYEYDYGAHDPIRLPAEDVIQWMWDTDPLNDLVGRSPLAVAAGRVDTDNFMKDFVKAFFVNAGVPHGLLNIEGAVDPEFRKEVSRGFRNDFGGPAGWHRLLIVDQKKASFTPMTAQLGTSGLVIPELDEISEARILMAFQVPPELLGARVGMKGSSYAEKRAARESFWDETLSPLYQLLAEPINLKLVPEYQGVQEFAFDLSTVRALLEDNDKLHARAAGDMNKGMITIEEARAEAGYPEVPTTGTFLIPANLTPVPARKVADDSIDIGEVRVGEPSPNGAHA